jgi:hypothetical protein
MFLVDQLDMPHREVWFSRIINHAPSIPQQNSHTLFVVASVSWAGQNEPPLLETHSSRLDTNCLSPSSEEAEARRKSPENGTLGVLSSMYYGINYRDLQLHLQSQNL